jgi:hypothetical protein
MRRIKPLLSVISTLPSVIPAKAGTRISSEKVFLTAVVISVVRSPGWVPAYAGMTNEGVVTMEAFDVTASI